MARTTDTSRGSKATRNTASPVTEQQSQQSFSLSLFVGHLLTSVFYAVYGLSVLISLKTGGLNKGIKAFNTQVLQANQITLNNDILLKLNQVLAFIFIGSPYLSRSVVFKRSVLLIGFLVLEWTTAVSAFGEVQKAIQSGNYQSLGLKADCWDKYGAFTLTLGSLLL